MSERTDRPRSPQQIRRAIAMVDAKLAAIEAAEAEGPHLVRVHDTYTGEQWFYGPYPTAIEALAEAERASNAFPRDDWMARQTVISVHPLHLPARASTDHRASA